MNKQQEPRLRFKDFTEVWEEKVLGEILSVRNEFVDSSLYDLDVELENLISNSGILVGDTSVRTQTTSSFRKGDILFGRLRPYLNKWWLAEKDGVKSGEIWALETSSKYSNSFAYLLVQSRKFLETANVTSGTKMPRADWRSLTAITFKSPSKPEQTHLGLFFSRLDSQIAESRAVLEKSRQLKKAMLAKMFPANGEKIPKIRFKGFEGEWECRKFSDIAELRRGLTYSPLDISPNGIRVLRSSNIDEENYIEKNDDVFVCKRAVNIPLVQNGDILITAANGSSRLVGKHAIIKTSRPAVHGGFMLLAKTENPYFLNASMSSAWYLDFIRIFVAGGNGAIGNLSIGDLNEQEILIPKNPEEQTAIGTFFRQLDETIALQSAEVEKLNQLKKGLLAAMLV
ncbi:restriction endonuclease subunit S [Neisseria perflava]|jgi:hsdS-type I specificity subunit|uniref:restriction endonuclease subunit S n=1 Tax=Neisseria perflava TaxID=33053 RepID=UPI003166E0E3